MDFEFADRSFSRRILTAGHQQQWGRLTLYTHYYQEKDNPNQTLGFSLSDEEKMKLSEAGDHLSLAYIPAVDSVGKAGSSFDYQHNQQADVPGVGNLYEVLYVKKDTVVAGNTYTVYDFTGKGDGVYKLSFTYMGEGKGNYQLNASSVNGKVYQWIAPLQDQPQGDYEPVRLLSTPKSSQVWSTGVQVKVSAQDKLYGEVALSRRDLNLFSSLDAGDDKGSAMTVGYQSGKRKVGFLPDYQWFGGLQYEYVGNTFSSADPYRYIEFERDWAVLPAGMASHTDLLSYADDQLLNLKMAVKKDESHHLAYQWTGRDRGTALTGGQHRLEIGQAFGHWQISADWFHLQSQQSAYRAGWHKLKADVHYDKNKIVPGYTFVLDKNTVTASATDSVVYAANHYQEHQVYLQSGDSLNNKFRIDYGFRKNWWPLAGKLIQSDDNHTINALTDLKIQENQHLKMRLTYRHTQVRQKEAFRLLDQSQGQENIVMGNADWSGQLFRQIVSTDWNYQVANGRELKREFVYVRVPVGEGTYTWRDDNANGVEELEEFYEARYWDERNYVRVFTTSSEYITAYSNQLNMQTSIQFPAQWLQTNGFRKWIAKFSNSTAWNIARKLSDEHMNQRLNPWAVIADAHLLYVRETLRSTLFFNRQNTRMGMEAGLKKNRRKQLLSGGFEERNTQSLLFNTRLYFSRMLGLEVHAEKKLDESHLDLVQLSTEANGRNFRIQSYSLTPQLAWQPKMNLRVSGKYGFTAKQNLEQTQRQEETMTGGEAAVIHAVGCDVRWSRLLSSTISASTEYFVIRYTGDAKNPVSYEMLDALQPGQNTRWTLSWQQKLWDGLQLTVNYQGRKSPAQSVIHSGSMMVRALF